MESIAPFIGMILGILSIVGFFGNYFYWKGKMDYFENACSTLPDRTKELETKMNVVWALFVDRVVSNGKLAKRGSGFHLTPEGEACLAKVEPFVDQVLSEHKDMLPSDVLLYMTEKIGYTELRDMAKESGCTLPELYALMTIKVGAKV